MRNEVQLDRAFVEMLIQRRSCDNRHPLMQAFGISDNTWRKIREGKPIRASLAQRLIERMASADIDAGHIN
ncbi:hypothetical protein [Sphingobium bisphenolivorans]|uniref:hypothetical protein n=1 Tax=Sphingobium bisphenolivorans TaxID=1335760 RepID=UPI0003A974A1|nr:hypothetical protein [Sphingobium bisphenolivorans]